MVSFVPFWRAWEKKVLQPLILKRIQREQALSPEALRRLQEKKLKAVLQHAVKYVPHYREAARQLSIDLSGNIWEIFKNFPYLEKRSMQEAPKKFISEKNPTRGTTEWSTSGSTGVPLKIRTNPEETAENQALVRFGFLEAGAKAGDKLLKLRSMTPAFSGLQTKVPDLFRWYAIDLKNPMSHNIRMINELKPDIIYSFPSYFFFFCQYLIESGETIHKPRLVAAFGEVVTPTLRALVKKAFGSELRDTYGTAELHRIAYECRMGKCHIIDSSVLIETIPNAADEKTPQQEGEEVLLTSLYHKTMPIIRYRIGDRVVFGKGPCACGSRGRILEKIIGRSDDFLKLPSGRQISAKAVNKLETVPGILEFQIIQRRQGLFEVLIRPSALFGPDQEAEVKKRVLSGCYGEKVEVNIKRVTDIPRNPIGKLQSVICQVI